MDESCKSCESYLKIIEIARQWLAKARNDLPEIFEHAEDI